MERIKQNILRHIPEPINLYSTLQPINILSKFCLLSIYQRKQTEEKERYEINILHLIINIIGLIGYTVYYYFSFTYLALMDIGSVERMLQYIGGTLSAGLALVEILLSMVLAKFMLKIYYGLDEVEGELRQLGLVVKYK